LECFFRILIGITIYKENSMEYCPNCIEALKRQSKKLGEFSVWLVCPKCGYRQRETSEYSKRLQNDRFDIYKKCLNKTKYSE
jgi:predicted RNA-binding Zn-ribbon protein involved in translation (DUF1610 family)